MSQLLVFGPQGEPIVLDDAEARSLCSAGVFSLTKPTAETRTSKPSRPRGPQGEILPCPECGRLFDEEDDDEQDECE